MKKALMYYYWLNQGGTPFQKRVTSDGGTFEAQTCLNEFISEIGQDFYNQCTFVLTPNGYKANKVYAVKPDDGSGDFDFVRATASNRYKDNSWQSLATGVPAIHYLGSSCPYLSLQPSKTNLLLNSATLSTQNVTVAASQYTLSFFGTGTVTLSGTSTAGPLVGTGVNNRVSLTFTPTAGTLTLTVSGSVTFAQLELGAYPSRWITTAGTSQSRNADVMTDKTGVSALIGQTEGTILFKFSLNSDAANRAFSVTDGTTSNAIRLNIDASNVAQFAIVTGGVSQVFITSALSVGVTYKVALTYANNYAAMFINGVKIGQDLTVTVPATSVIRFGGTGTSPFYGNLFGYIVNPIRISDAEAVTLTS